MASIDAWYNSSSRPELRPPEETCPIKQGDEFGAGITVSGLNRYDWGWLTAAFYLWVEGHKEWNWGEIYVPQPGVGGHSGTFVIYCGHPSPFESYGLAFDRKIDTRKEAAWGDDYPILPGSPEWEVKKIASDGDAGVYVNQTPVPNISWIQIISAVPQMV